MAQLLIYLGDAPFSNFSSLHGRRNGLETRQGSNLVFPVWTNKSANNLTRDFNNDGEDVRLGFKRQ